MSVNATAVADPGLVERDPYDEGWMIELEPSALGEETGGLAHGADEIATRFRARVFEYRRDGVLAE